MIRDQHLIYFWFLDIDFFLTNIKSEKVIPVLGQLGFAKFNLNVVLNRQIL